MPDTPTEAPRPARASRAPFLVLIAIALAAALAALFWIDTRQRIGSTQEELARRLRDIEADARDAPALARQSQDTVREAQTRIGQLESRLVEWQGQQPAPGALHQGLSPKRDGWQRAE